MKKKKILIISYSYPPANVPAAQRPYSIAKYLDKEKFEVTVLTCGNQDSSLGFNTNFNEALYKVNHIKVDGFKVSKKREVVNDKNTNNKKNIKGKIKKNLTALLSYFVFPDKAAFWYPLIKKYIKSNKDQFQFDIIFSTSPMFTNHLVALQVKKINPNAILIADFRDYHYLATSQFKKIGIKSLLNKKLEKKVIKNFNKICFISNAMKNEYSKYYKNSKNKFHVLYNGFDFEEYDLKPVKIRNKKLTIFYAGSFYQGIRNPLPLLNILEKLIKENIITENDVQIEIAGNIENDLVENIKALKIFKSIRFLGLLPRREVLKKYKESHLLWLITGNKVTHYTGVPIKFYEYLASQRPIINFAPHNSEPTRIINELHLGWNFDTNVDDINKHFEIFKKIIHQYKQGNLAINVDLKKIEKYSRAYQTKLLEKLF